MSEIIKTQNNGTDWRLRLLGTVSVLTLLGTGISPALGQGDDGAPTVWVELGGQFERINQQQAPFLPAFTPELLSNGFDSPARIQRSPSNVLGFEGSISLQPQGSDWLFKAGIRYGRSNSARQSHQQVHATPHYYIGNRYFGTAVYKFSDARTNNASNHAILDFSAGKDIGIGFFGSNSKSVFALGVRYAQFGAKSSAALHARPGYHFSVVTSTSRAPTGYVYIHGKKHLTQSIHTAAAGAQRSFHGIGPSLSWDASVPVAGSKDSAEFTIDWGANAALLFGRQKVNFSFSSSNSVIDSAQDGNNLVVKSGHFLRSRSVIVPNVGGFAGMSLKFPNANISLGYRADFFANAMDTGIDTRSKSNIGFYGPFASISIGLGG